MIPLTYHDAKYTALTPHTYTAWAALEEESSVRVVTKTASVEFAVKNGPYQRDIEMYGQAMDAANIPYERINAD